VREITEGLELSSLKGSMEISSERVKSLEGTLLKAFLKLLEQVFRTKAYFISKAKEVGTKC
jgi:hypothetical protein